MKCAEHKKELLGYTAKVYPYESGYRCPRCGREWSDLEIARAKRSLSISGGLIAEDILFEENDL